MSESEIISLFRREMRSEIASTIEGIMREPGQLAFHRTRGNVVDLLLDIDGREAVLSDVLGDLDDEHLSFAQLSALLEQWRLQHGKGKS